MTLEEFRVVVGGAGEGGSPPPTQPKAREEIAACLNRILTHVRLQFAGASSSSSSLAPIPKPLPGDGRDPKPGGAPSPSDFAEALAQRLAVSCEQNLLMRLVDFLNSQDPTTSIFQAAYAVLANIFVVLTSKRFPSLVFMDEK